MTALNDLLMPKLGLTMTEGLLETWNVQPGDRVSAGQVILTVQTDKVSFEIEAEAAGEIREVLIPAGETVPVGTVVARWTGPGQGAPDAHGAARDSEPPAVPETAGAVPLPEPSRARERIISTPLARRVAREHGLDLRGVRGSGPNGRIKMADVRAAIDLRPAAVPAPAATMPAAAAPPPTVEKRAPDAIGLAMARRMVEAKPGVPHFYLAAEAEVSALLDLREKLNTVPDAPKLTLNHLVVAAVARALEALPQQNRIWLDGEIASFGTIDVGVAVSTPRGLFAPVVQDLGRRGLDEVAARVNAVVRRARDGALRPADMRGGAISVSNGGMFNVTYMTPIINAPQSAILGVGSVREVFRPDGSGAPSLRREMGLVLSADHRLHDGTSGLIFLNHVIALLERPLQLLRNVPAFEG
ncbi:dihydrolipoamide acetyltransferase family protein [Xanthobacter oligotrophicus]|uniref:Dihydrolipoamide acetyltransferase component of pyruvate dehydrogenase complex n=1 Tax=Xanthobacter oligotrophicus TaxID=2607286 RepID=A0ABW7A2N6_9HYPH